MTTSPETVFITGATGLVGSHVARRYLAAGAAVSALRRPSADVSLLADVADQITWYEGDITDIPSLEKAIMRQGGSLGLDVIHAAAVVSFSPKDRDRMEKINVEGTANVVNVCLKAGVRKLGYISSVAALGRPSRKGIHLGQSVVLTEDQKWEDSPTLSFYAKTKYRAELEVWRGIAEGLNAVLVNPSVILGVGDWTKSSAQLVKYVYDERPFYTDGDLNYVDVLDVTEALFTLMQSDITAERFILNAGTLPYKVFFEQLAHSLHKRPPGVRVPPVFTKLLWPLEALRTWVTGGNPLITRETAQSASGHYHYMGTKIEQTAGFHYRPLAQTLARLASAYAPA